MQNEKIGNYFLGLDVGTDSVGYAVTDEGYALCRHRGRPLWGVHLFEGADTAEERRGFRTARRRIDRRQQRVALVGELLAAEIAKVDPNFLIRRAESARFRTEDEEPFRIFCEEGADAVYHKRYPTVHHLIKALMEGAAEPDVRLLYIACAWLVAHRGHFLSEVDRENVDAVLDFGECWEALLAHLEEAEWPYAFRAADRSAVEQALRGRNMTEKYKALCEAIFGAPRVPKDKTAEPAVYDCDALLRLLAGGKVALAKLFCNDAYKDNGSVELGCDDATLATVLAGLEDDGRLIALCKAIYDWSVLVRVIGGRESISAAKVEIYEKHQCDLRLLKRFVKKYLDRAAYDALFRRGDVKENYAAYVGCYKGAPVKRADRCDHAAFLAALKKTLARIKPDEGDAAAFAEIEERVKTGDFLPKQVDPENRVIPYQLYWHEMRTLLTVAEGKMPFLLTAEGGTTVSEKLLSVMSFRVPYFVGPLRKDGNKHAWIERRAGRITPWNFREMVDLDASEENFIKRMTATCTYLPGEAVLPKQSLLYSSFELLNELNNLKVDGAPISVEVKQRLYSGLFFARRGRVTKKTVRDYLAANNLAGRDAEITGIDDTVKSSLRPYQQFMRILEGNTLTPADVERIIARATVTEDRTRLLAWLGREYPTLPEGDRRYIAGLRIAEYGRLSRRFLCEVYGTPCDGSGEAHSIIEMLWLTNENLQQLLSERYTYRKTVDELRREYYAAHPKTVEDEMDDLYLSKGVRRPIYRALAVVEDVVGAMGAAPRRIFVEMARGANEEQKGRRTVSRADQLRELYAKTREADVRLLNDQLAEMGEAADTLLQSDALFLYYLQLGRCMYTGEALDITALKSGVYNIDHIYPQCHVKDDSLVNNRVLVTSVANEAKEDVYPVAADVRAKMAEHWARLYKLGAISEEKYYRLTRHTPFTEEERIGFINRQLVETRQSTKAIAAFLAARYPKSEIVYVKAGLVSEFRQKFECPKSRLLNDLHHAKDAYLNVAVGNVYHTRFSGFCPHGEYSIKPNAVFGRPLKVGGRTVWEGGASIDFVKKTLQKGNVRVTRFAFTGHGGLFKQMPLPAGHGQIERKKGMPIAVYGGYDKATTAFFTLASYTDGKKRDVMLVAVDLMSASRFVDDDAFTAEYLRGAVAAVLGREAQEVTPVAGYKVIKMHSVLSFDGLEMCLAGKSSGGSKVVLSILTPLLLPAEWEGYLKRLDSFCEKLKKNPGLLYREEYDVVSTEKNLALYDLYLEKLSAWPYEKRPANPCDLLREKREAFAALSVKEQATLLRGIHGIFRGASVDLSPLGGATSAGVLALGTKLSGWAKSFRDVRLLDRSAAGVHERRSGNLLDLL